MVMLPAICDRCGTVFPSSIVMSNETAFLKGNKSGPCPKCGSVGSVPDGTYEVANEVATYFINEDYSINEYKKLKDIFQNALQNDFTFEQLEEATESNGLKLSDILPQNRDEARSDIKWFIGIVISILSIVIPLMINQYNHESETNLRSEAVIQEAVRYLYKNPELLERTGRDNDD